MSDHRGETTGPRVGPVTRRGVLAGAGVGAILIGVGERNPLIRDLLRDAAGTPRPDVAFNVVRAEDGLFLTVRLYDMSLSIPGTGAPFIAVSGSAPLMVVDFPTQTIGEESWELSSDVKLPTYEAIGKQDVNGYRARAVADGLPTRLAFAPKPGTTRLTPALRGDATTPGLLDWHLLDPVLSPGIDNTTVSNDKAYTGPTDRETSIGAPYGLATSPTSDANWLHVTHPVTHVNDKNSLPYTELWHTRLGAWTPATPTTDRELKEYPAVTPAINAVWCAGFTRAGTAPHDDDFAATSYPLVQDDRIALVRLTSDHLALATDGTDYVPAPADAKRMILTPEGASTDIHGSWIPPQGINVNSWTHHSTHGRDHHVVVSYLGFLLPFGHPAVLVKETVRRFEASPTGSPMANLRTMQYVIIRQHEKTYGDHSGTEWQLDDGRNLPFRRVRINTLKTPNLTFNPYNGVSGRFTDAQGTVPGVATCIAQGAPYQFNVTAWDWEGDKVDFTVPMAFVTRTAANQESSATSYPVLGDASFGNEGGAMGRIRTAYNKLDEGHPWSTARLHGQRVAVAESVASGDTTLRFDTMTFGLIIPDPLGATTDFAGIDQPRANPVMRAGTARIPTVQAITPGAASRVYYDGDYITGDFGSSNPSSVFLQVDGQKLDFTAGAADAHPGVITPNLDVGGLSRQRGLVGGPHAGSGGIDLYKNCQLAPAAFLSGAKVLGGLDLATIIAGGANTLGDSPTFTTTTSYPNTRPDGTPDRTTPTLTTTLSWRPPLITQTGANPVFTASTESGGAASFRLDATVVSAGDGSPPVRDVSGVLRNFTLNLFGGDPAFLKLQFREFSFHSRNGSKPTVVADVAKAEFQGALKFVNTLEEILGNEDNAQAIQVLPDRVIASTGAALPSIPLGIFSLTNVSFSAAVDIPFGAEPARVRFAFASPEKPFLLSVMVFSGGGSVQVDIGSDGVERLMVLFEFGAHIGIDVGVASGSIEIMAGLTITTGVGNGEGKSLATTLTGFFKAHGELRFGFVGVSLTFQMSLTHQSSDNSVTGQVLVRVEVSVFCFSGEVKFTARKKFAGGNDPTFADMVSSTDYSTYVGAFA